MMEKNYFKFIISIILILLSPSLYAQEKQSIKEKIMNLVIPPITTTIDNTTNTALQDLSLYSTLAEVTKPIVPFLYGQYFIFIHYDDTQKDRTFIAFEHEYYNELHRFVRLTNNKNVSVFILPQLYVNQNINYRMVINGIWMIDYNNPQSQIDSRGIQVSSVFIPMVNPLFLSPIVKIDESTIRFYLYLNSNKLAFRDTNFNVISPQNITKQTVFLTGNFTNWDPFLLPMTPVENVDNLYYVDISLKEGTYYYYFQMGSTDILDPKNKQISKRNSSGTLVNSFEITSTVMETTGAKTHEVSTNYTAQN